MQLASPSCIKVQQCDAMLTGNNMGCNTGGLNRFQARSEITPFFSSQLSRYFQIPVSEGKKPPVNEMYIIFWPS